VRGAYARRYQRLRRRGWPSRLWSNGAPWALR
jgi:hypothetical protein